ncbi:HAMP domain-containing protein, partial [Xanthomonas citri pv. citri]|nr:HAMP domain-containing protein [Xanthomonas citri pv. citri]
LSASMQGHLDLETGLRWLSVITALVAVVLAFVVSGFVASFITRPVTEVTTRAQELARGNYEIRFRKDYFCAEIRELSDALDHARS